MSVTTFRREMSGTNDHDFQSPMPNLDILTLTLDFMMLNQTKKNAFWEMLPDIRTGLDFLNIGLKK